MGLNIIPYRIVVKENGCAEEENYNPFGFDTLRYSWDDEFARYLSSSNVSCVKTEDVNPWFFNRPQDFDAAREWVERNVGPKGNKARLLELLANLEKLPDVWLHFSR